MRELTSADPAELTHPSPTVFVIDDEAALRDIICQILRSEGYTCKDFRNGVEALAALDAGTRCDLVMTDLLNAPMDGFDLLLSVKEKFPGIPVLVASAVDDVAVRRACMMNGAEAYLHEPCTREQILQMVSFVHNSTREAFRVRSKAVSEMTIEEMGEALLTSQSAGLPNLRALNEVEQRDGPSAVKAISMLEWHDLRGRQRDTLVRAKALTLKEVSLDAYHDATRHDRFVYRGRSASDLEHKLNAAREILRKKTIHFVDDIGSLSMMMNVDFTFGVGNSLNEAEEAERRSRIGEL